MTQSRFADEDTLAHIAQLEAENARLREELDCTKDILEQTRVELANTHNTWLSPETYKTLMQERQETLHELAAAQKDAERYRWIKEESQPHQWKALDDTPYAQWDAAIDEAMKENEK